MDKKTIIIVATISGLVVLFIFLLYINKPFAQQLPVIGSFFPKTSVTTTTSTASQPNTAQGNLLATPVITTDSVMHPVNGSALSPAGAYQDGTYPGSSATTTGVIQIQVSIADGKMTTITMLMSPPGTDGVIASLIAEAIKSQTVEVSPINGYDNISIAFQTALANAVKLAFKP